jgi:16S rRNA (cytosine1402-N4)-methyltransferase
MESHITVLLKEAVEALRILPDHTVVDATLGSGGHSREILSRLETGGRYIGIDADPRAIEHAQEVLKGTCSMHFAQGNFRAIDSILNAQGIHSADGILADLGWRMEQFSGNGKGFSFQVDEPLRMTFGDPSDYVFTAHDIVNEWEPEHIESILTGYGEEKFARRIVSGILKAREEGPIMTTFALAKVISDSVPSFYRYGKLNPATRTFQALRIAVNDELGALEEFLRKSFELLTPGGHLAVITFHSLEDRIVKHAFLRAKEEGIGIPLTKKPLTPHDDEIKGNPRSRSAKLRVFEKYEHPLTKTTTL